ncbi:MAG: transcriptional regulator [Candidatus Aenigmarchaeota archaeon ex4484_56]|nr:MAG: transcriptional regulator [Candidatus Aenigmarchaeota archaeon ex4484_56]
MIKTPCEKVIWSILPSIRREFAEILVKELNLSQKEVAQKLNLTNSAISQYLKSKRGKEIKFNRKINAEIKKIAMEIFEGKEDENIMEKICHICKLVNKK